MTNKFKDLKPYFGDKSKTDTMITHKKITGAAREKIVKEIIQLIRENKKLTEEYKTNQRANGVLFG